MQLDFSEEATNCDHCHFIYIRWHILMVNKNHQSQCYCVWYQVCWHCRYKDQSMQCIECYVTSDMLDTGPLRLLLSTVYRGHLKCEGYFNLYKVTWLTLKWGRLLYCAFGLVGLAVHQSEEAALLTFLWLVNYKGDYRQDATANPQFLKRRGHSATHYTGPRLLHIFPCQVAIIFGLQQC